MYTTFHLQLLSLRVSKNYFSNLNSFFHKSIAKHVDESRLSRNTHKVNNLERRFLIWTKSRYKTLDDVPDYVPASVMEKARSKMRIAISLGMMVFSIIGALVMIKLGKNAQARGESLQQRNINWHDQLRKEAMREKAEK